MTEQTKDKIKNQIRFYSKAITSDESRFVMAKEVMDRLFVSNYLNFEEMMDFIKNELTSMLSLSVEQTQIILKQFEEKYQMINDKLEIAKLKLILEETPIYESDELHCFNLIEVKKIVRYIINNNLIANKQILQDFVINDLSTHFKLNEENKKEVMEVLNDDKS